MPAMSMTAPMKATPAPATPASEPARAAQVVFICPNLQRIMGGIKYVFRMAEVLRRSGHDAIAVDAVSTPPFWFQTDVPVFGRDIIGQRANQVLVIGEDIPGVLERNAKRPQRKVMYCQNHFYAAQTATEGGSYADFGITDVLCSGRAIYDYIRLRHPNVRAHLIPCGIDSAVFHPRVKRERIACIPRKRRIEAAYLRDLFRHLHPEFRDVEWLELESKTEPEVAAALGESTVFLSLSRLEGFGLTPIEAMASGCVVAGFTGIGGREYATSANGFWADEDDFPGCLRQLAEAIRLSRDTTARATYFEACAHTVSQYTPDAFERAVRAAWGEILSNHA
jgi:hypothetical protein